MKRGFTLAEVLLAVGIVGLLAVLIVPVIVTKYQNRTFKLLYDREVNGIESAVNNLAVAENKVSFFHTIMYRDSDPQSYGDNSGMFLKKYLRVTKYCGDSNGNCFASKYYKYDNKDKVQYTPEYKGACASLKNGVSVCIIPQIGANKIKGIIDINGPKGPNVYGTDLKDFVIESKTRQVILAERESVIALDNTPIEGASEEPKKPDPPVVDDPCKKDNNSPECCKKRSITDSGDVCCTFEDIKNSNPVCAEDDFDVVFLFCNHNKCGFAVSNSNNSCKYTTAVPTKTNRICFVNSYHTLYMVIIIG